MVPRFIFQLFPSQADAAAALSRAIITAEFDEFDRAFAGDPQAVAAVWCDPISAPHTVPDALALERNAAELEGRD